MAKVWTEETTAKLSEAYAAAIKANGGKALEPSAFKTLAYDFDVTEHSARQKLVSMKEYVSPDAKAKVGNPSATRKIEVVKQIADTTGLTVDSLEKANKGELEALAAFVEQQAAIIEDLEMGSDDDTE
tara:strand:- start:20935 stop:21318 length:384 start_codon:yes stop_codon:yes gene_type:complete